MYISVDAECACGVHKTLGEIPEHGTRYFVNLGQKEGEKGQHYAADQRHARRSDDDVVLYVLAHHTVPPSIPTPSVPVLRYLAEVAAVVELR